jgi:hypothetical protein
LGFPRRSRGVVLGIITLVLSPIFALTLASATQSVAGTDTTAFSRAPPTPGADVSHLIHSINLAVFGTNDQFMNDAATQSIVTKFHIPYIRMPFRDGWSDAQYNQLLQAIHNTGATPVVIIHGNCTDDASNQPVDDHWLSLADAVFTAGSYLVEYGNEETYSCNEFNPARPGISVQQYVAGWNRDVRGLRTHHPRAKFVGPTAAWYDEGVFPYFLQNATPHPNYISWHWYPCPMTVSDATCLQSASGADGADIAAANQDMQNAGYTVPVIISEWDTHGDSGDPRFDNQAFLQQFMSNVTAGATTLASNPSNHISSYMFYNLDGQATSDLLTATNAYTFIGKAFFGALSR